MPAEVLAIVAATLGLSLVFAVPSLWIILSRPNSTSLEQVSRDLARITANVEHLQRSIIPIHEFRQMSEMLVHRLDRFEGCLRSTNPQPDGPREVSRGQIALAAP